MKIWMRIRLPADEVWQLVADREAQQQWMGPGTSIEARQRSRLALYDSGGEWRRGTVTGVLDRRQIRCRLAPAADWAPGQRPSLLRLSLAQHPKGGCRVTVEENGLQPGNRASAEAFWKAALKRLQRLAAGIRKRRRNPRQAVIVIHGIGEQEPGVTLREFFNGVFGRSSGKDEAWSKPDRASRIFELRRMTVKATQHQRRPSTDLFELYWAHVIRDTTSSQVASWLRHLLVRWRVPSQLWPLWAAFWVLAGALLVFAFARAAGLWAEWTRLAVGGGVLAALGLWVSRLVGKAVVLDTLGDAARYLTPRPSNIRHRQEIREAGVDLLHKLHSQGSFDRIAIVGHSLGSVIAYDVITQYWIQVHREHQRLPHVRNTLATAVERALEVRDAKEAQSLQHKAWHQCRANSQPWLITDLITLGSPLSMADFLVARSPDELQRAQRDRVLPTCPPQPEPPRREGARPRVSFEQVYHDRFGGRDRVLTVFHHAAPFAVTRWTNFHFPSSVASDPIGGRLAPHFGDWVRDVQLPVPRPLRGVFRDGWRFYRRRSWLLHTRYWQGGPEEVHIRALVEALGLESGRDLLAALRRHSPLLYLPRPE